MGIPTVAFIGQGKLLICRPGQPPEPIDSPFIARIVDRAEQERERHGWRGDGMMWNFGARGSQRFSGIGVPNPGAAASEGRLDARFLSVAAGRDGLLLYSIATSSIGGLFEYDPATGHERRLVHKANFYAEGLTAHPITGELAFCVRHADGSAAIGVAGPDGSKHRVVTEGDSIDESPAWAAGDERRIVFQSSGIARTEAGVAADLTVARVEVLELEKESLSVVVEDVGHDYLSPRLAADGTLYAIRRPFESMVPHVSPFRLLLDLLLFPFRLLMAIAAFLNVFSMFFRQQPLFTAGGPRVGGADLSRIRLWGRWVDTKKALARRANGAEQALVGPEWKLVRRDAAGNESVVADRVVHFDLCPDGSIVYTNGSRIRHRAPDGRVTEIASGKLVERVAVLSDRGSPTADDALAAEAHSVAGSGAGGS